MTHLYRCRPASCLFFEQWYVNLGSSEPSALESPERPITAIGQENAVQIEEKRFQKAPCERSWTKSRLCEVQRCKESAGRTGTFTVPGANGVISKHGREDTCYGYGIPMWYVNKPATFFQTALARWARLIVIGLLSIALNQPHGFISG